MKKAWKEILKIVSVVAIVYWVLLIAKGTGILPPHTHQETLRLIATGEAKIKPHTIAPDGTVMEWQLVPVNPNGKELK